MWPLDLLSEPVWQRVTWTLLHLLWQGLLVAVLLAAVLWLFRVRRAEARYALCLTAMAAMAGCLPVTFAVLQFGAGSATAERGPVAAQPSSATAPRSPAVTPRSPAVAAGEMGLRPRPASPRKARPTKSPSETPPTIWPAPAQAAGSWKSRVVDYAGAVQPYLLAGWFAGVFLFSGRLVLAHVAVRWLRRAGRPISAELASQVARLGEKLGLRSVPPVLACRRIGQAIVLGFFRPLILLPAAWLTEMTPEMLQAVIAHELAHIRRWDLWVNLLQRLMETLLFYHPAVWWLSRRVRLQREMCCDEAAVAAIGDRAAYANVLELVGRKQLTAIPPELGAAMGGNKMALLSRVRNVLGLTPSHEKARWWPVGLALILVLLTLCLLGTVAARPQPPVSPEREADTNRKPEDKAVGRSAEPYRVKPFDLLVIKVLGTLLDQPIDRVYLVEPSGRVSLGPAYGRVQLKGLTLEEAESTIKTHLLKILHAPEVQVTSAGRVTRWRFAVLPKAPYHVGPRDLLTIRVAGTLIGQPIEGTYSVEPTGNVPLGPAYGRVELEGLTLQQAEDAIEKHLKQVLAEPVVSVTMAGWKVFWREPAVPKPPYRIAPGDLVDVQAIGTLDGKLIGTIGAIHLVEPSGQVTLGPAYGRVQIKGLTLEEAEDAIEKHLKQVLKDSMVSVTMAGWKSDQKERSGGSLEQELAQWELQAAVLKERERSIAAEVEKQKAEVERVAKTSADIERHRVEIEVLDQILSSIFREKDALVTELRERSAEPETELKRSERLDKLKSVYAQKAEERRQKRSVLKRLGEQLGTSDSAVLSVKERHALEEYRQYRQELTRVQLELMRAKGEVEARKALLNKVKQGATQPQTPVKPDEALPRHYRNTGRLLVDQVLLIEHWEKFETNEQFREVVQDLQKRLTTQQYLSRFIVPKSPRKETQPEDEFERQLLQRLLEAKPDKTADKAKAEFAERMVPQRSEYQYYQPIRAQESCVVVCHIPTRGGGVIGSDGSAKAGFGGTTALAEGDLMGIVRVTIPMSPR